MACEDEILEFIDKTYILFLLAKECGNCTSISSYLLQMITENDNRN
jgi:hypothetical protein